jgi:enamine deaminase RidA (YjgF/YER057c/UK114 family)
MTLLIETVTSAASQIEGRLFALGLTLPQAPQPVGAYRALVFRHGIGAVSGQFPLCDGQIVQIGRVGAELGIEQGRVAARQAALNVLAQVAQALAPIGGWDRFAGLLRLEGYVASAPDFVDQPQLLDAASELLVAVLGDALGAHSRAAIAVPQLPLSSPVELVVTFAIHPMGPPS